MSEKQFEAFDERFKNAATQHDPPFDEASWQKLEAMLDAQEKRRRRAAWWWLPDALMLGLLLYIAAHLLPATVGSDKPNVPGQNQTQKSRTATATTGENLPALKNDPALEPGIPASQATAVVSPKLSSSQTSAQNPVSKPARQESMATSVSINQPVFHSKNTTRNRQPVAGAVQPAASEGQPIGVIHQSTGGLVLKEGTQTATAEASSVLAVKADPPGNNMVQEFINGLPQLGNNAIFPEEMAIEKIEEPGTVKQSLQNEKKLPAGNTKTSGKNPTATGTKGLYVYGMAGSEWSLVPGNDAGKATFAWGVGLGYRLSSKWAIQAGYFSTRKLYAAGPGDYKPKPGTYYYNLNIKHVEANCNITEIPIAVSYNILNLPKQSLYASLGFSSYIMNSEEYHYDYIRANQMPGYARYRYETHNSHLFAGLLISGGYSHQLFRGFSVSAEPYFKLPLYGVGEGSIKIYSFGLMAGAKYSLPSFRKK